MKINIFKIQSENYESLIQKFENIELVSISTITLNNWICDFYLSDNPDINDIAWVKDFQNILSEEEIQNKIYFAVYLCKKDDDIFAMTYGKSHFYVRNFCDIDFGLNMATRIGNEKDVKQIASKRFAGKKKKEIKSFTSNSKLDSESGESVDYVSSSIIESKQSYFGKNSKFGSSMIVSRADLNVDTITDLLEEIIRTLSESQIFPLPKTEIINKDSDISRYDLELLSKIKIPTDDVSTINDSHDLIGVDFVFSGVDKYCFIYGGNKSEKYDEVTLDDLRNFININQIDDNNIFNIKIRIENENQKFYTKKLKQFIEYTNDDEKIVLQNGKWIKFNEEYVNQINELVDSIDIETTENEFQAISTTETIFNDPLQNTVLSTLNYNASDKDFSQLQINGNYKVEAWDLQKDDTVYAVKFGKSQKLVYVCNQAVATLEIIRNKANLKKLNNFPKKYCLWFGFERSVPEKISKVNSIILKQQIDLFARRCREIGIEPVLKFSQKI